MLLLYKALALNDQLHPLVVQCTISSVSHRENNTKNFFSTGIAPVNGIYILLQKSP